VRPATSSRSKSLFAGTLTRVSRPRLDIEPTGLRLDKNTTCLFSGTREAGATGLAATSGVTAQPRLAPRRSGQRGHRKDPTQGRRPPLLVDGGWLRQPRPGASGVVSFRERSAYDLVVRATGHEPSPDIPNLQGLSKRDRATNGPQRSRKRRQQRQHDRPICRKTLQRERRDSNPRPPA
jgi:hypothetical protein